MEQGSNHGRQPYSEDDGEPGSNDDRAISFFLRQSSAGQGNHHRIVAAKNDVDENDVENKQKDVVVQWHVRKPLSTVSLQHMRTCP